MDQLLSTSPQTLYWDEAGTPGYVTVASTDHRWAAFLQAAAPITMLVALCGVVGNSVVFCLLFFLARSSPHAAYVLNLAVVDIIGLSCITLILLDKILLTHHGAALHAAVLLEPVSYFSETVELCLLAALSLESLLCVLCPTGCLHRRPKHTSAVVCALTWALAAALHVASEVCDSLVESQGCDRFLDGVGAFHLLVCAVMWASSLALMARDLCCLPVGWLSGVCHAVRTAVASFLLWGLPAIVFVYLQAQEYLAFALDLLLLLSSVVGAVHPASYFLAGYLGKMRGRESLKIAFHGALMGDLEAGRRARGEAGLRAASEESPSLQLCSPVEASHGPPQKTLRPQRDRVGGHAGTSRRQADCALGITDHLPVLPE